MRRLTTTRFCQAGKIVTAVCHGPAALVGVTDTQGKYIFAGKVATGFSNAEEIQVDMVKDIPFLVEGRLMSLGGKYEKAADLWKTESNTSTDRRTDLGLTP
ncbi:class I glutamine amidotransferase-like protein [Mycena galopus ATCC 62051]|nr:class I glutamine amidotransferase-like protein [Mycena galopus ATCC 62051]